jgi:hypothetical protein
MTRSVLACLIGSTILIGACNRPSQKASDRIQEQYIPVSSAVAFDIEPLPGGNGSALWLATYSSQGKTARFEIELGSAAAIDDKESKAFDIDIKSGKGRLIAVQQSDASVLLADLKRALEARVIPANVQRADSLSFEFVSFGEHQSQATDGGFAPKPTGNWTPMKIFIGKGEGEGQVFLNLNPVIKKGQFSIKDADYDDIVLRQLARVL